MFLKSTMLLLFPLYSVVAQQIPEGTKIRVRLEQALSSATAEVGQPVQLAVTDDIRVNDDLVIPRNSVVNGSVVQAVPKRRMGRTGKLDFSIDEIALAGGDKIPLRYSVVKKEGGSHAVSTGVITAGVAVVFWPAAPFVLLRKGKDTTFNKGMTFDVFTDVAFQLKPAASITSRAEPGPALTTTGAPAQQAAIVAKSGPPRLKITSAPEGAEITLDGQFVGSTPTVEFQPPEGTRILVIKKRGYVPWERTLQLRPGDQINVVAELEPEPQDPKKPRILGLNE